MRGQTLNRMDFKVTNIHKDEYRSENGKYVLSVWVFEGDITPMISCFEVVNGLNRPMKRRHLPNYMKEQLDRMEYIAKRKIKGGRSF